MSARRQWIVFAALSLAAACAFGAEGQLDPTFGAAGRVYLGWDADGGHVANDFAVAVLAPSDGSVILVGNATDAGSGYSGVNAVAVAKLTPRGTFDTSFGDVATPGQTKIHGAGNFPYSGRITATNAALQADGKIVIVGNTYFPEQQRSLATVWRLTADGALDVGFGSGGSTAIDRGQLDEYDGAFSVAIVHGVKGTSYDAMEGRIVVAGSYDFDHSLVVAQSWIFELNPDGSPVPNTVDGGKGQNTYDWDVTDCSDNGNYYHDQLFTAIRFLYVPETNTLRFYAAGDCIARPGTSVPSVPYVAAIDANLDLIGSFGNNDNGISEVSFMHSGQSYPNSFVTSLDVDPGNRMIVYAGYFTAADGRTQVLEGGLDSAGQFVSSWTNGGVTAFPVGAVGGAAYAIRIRPNHGQSFLGAYDILAGRFDDGPCQPDVVCALPGAHLMAAAIYFGTLVPYCGLSAGEICHYEYSNMSDEGAYAMNLTEGNKVLLAGYVTFTDGHTDFAVVRLQGEQIFFDGFGYGSQDFR